ncbi:hypothetical protein SCHPADRAFT_886475 [Schizopora paradoxa]|uniref:GST N-terminal domain-containing protein n=1 Tax=Schizopora paradoxa TaxID=27342 RepID=A0A0H2S2D5_9AGAM|nr:hypothetical protein SCHPADRAFT_886475 [Schizopora paradoxa]
MSITLFDFPSSAPGKTLSRNTIKIRLALAFKGLSFKTEWLELSEIEPKMKQIGADPTSTREDGSPLYTLPVIQDHSTGRIVSDSMHIAFYLDDTYPERPALFPYSMRAPIVTFDLFFFPTVFRVGRGADLVNHEAFKKLAPASIEYIRRTQGDEYMARVAKLSDPGTPQREALWEALRVGFSKVSDILSSNTESFFYGSTLSFADFIIVAHLLWMKASLGAESTDWKDFEKWDDGRWMKLSKYTEKYQVLGD